MYASAMEFLEEERDAWLPYEALIDLSDEQLDRPTPPDGPAHGWTARDLLGHVLAWQGFALAVATELAVGEETPTRDRVVADWDARGDAVNDEWLAEWRALPLEEVRRRARQQPGELRGYLTVVPETRWIKNPDVFGFFFENTTEHYEEHAPELEAVLASAQT